MPLDPNIALSFKPSVALEDPMQQYGRMQQIQANAMAMRQARNENALAQQTAMAGQKTALEEKAVNKLYSENYDPTTGEVNMNKVMEGAAKLGLGGKIPGMQTAALETKGKAQDVESKFLSNVKSAMDNSRFRLETVTTPAQAIQWHEQNHKDPTLQEYFRRINLSPEQARAQIEAVAGNPPAFQALLQKMQLGLDKAQLAVDAAATRAVTTRGQDISAETTRRGQNISAETARLDRNAINERARLDRAAKGGDGDFLSKLSKAEQKDYRSLIATDKTVDSALTRIEKTPTAFGFGKGAATSVGGVTGGRMGASIVSSQMTDDEIQARSFVYNIVSAAIKERAGTAQSAQELKVLDGFLPSPFDDSRVIKAKLKAFKEYINTKREGYEPADSTEAAANGDDPLGIR